MHNPIPSARLPGDTSEMLQGLSYSSCDWRTMLRVQPDWCASPFCAQWTSSPCWSKQLREFAKRKKHLISKSWASVCSSLQLWHHFRSCLKAGGCRGSDNPSACRKALPGIGLFCYLQDPKIFHGVQEVWVWEPLPLSPNQRLLFTRREGEWGGQLVQHSFPRQGWNEQPWPNCDWGREKSQEPVILPFSHSEPPHQQAGSSQHTAGELVVIRRWRNHPVERRVTWLWYLNSLLLTASVQVSWNPSVVLSPFNKMRRHQHIC